MMPACPEVVALVGRVNVKVSGARMAYAGAAGMEMVRVLSEERVNVKSGCTTAFHPDASDCEDTKAARIAVWSSVAAHVWDDASVTMRV